MSILNGRDLKSLLNLTGEQVCAHLAGDFLYFSLAPIFICGYTSKVACVGRRGRNLPCGEEAYRVRGPAYCMHSSWLLKAVNQSQKEQTPGYCSCCHCIDSACGGAGEMGHCSVTHWILVMLLKTLPTYRLLFFNQTPLPQQQSSF